MTPAAAKALLALCVCPPAVMTTLVATSPPARQHMAKAVRHALRQAPPALPKPAALAAPAAAPIDAATRCAEGPPAAGLAVPVAQLDAVNLLLSPPAGGAFALAAGPVPGPVPGDDAGGAAGFLPPARSLTDGLPGGLGQPGAPPPAGFGLPEPTQWVLMTLGFGAVGAAVRSRRPSPAAP